jgi:hypothetical protein
MLNEIARNKLDEAGADRRTARTLHVDKVREGSAALQGSDWVVLRRGSPFRDRSSVCRAPGNGTHAAVELPTVLPIRILQLSPAAQHLNANKCNSIESV